MPWDETDTQIFQPLRDVADFKDGTLRTIPIQKAKPRVWGIVGKPKDGGGMALQGLRFPKEDGWTLASAKAWFKVHGDAFKNFDLEVAMEPEQQTKDYKFEVKDVTDEGTFTGVLSVYDVVDLGNDLVEKGAFARTLQHSLGNIPCLWQHSEPIGTLQVMDTGNALEVKGKLVLEVQRAREALALMKAGAVKGMSIGYRTVKAKIEDGVRHLKELALMEGSVVTFPMLPAAQITSVKSLEAKDDFATELDHIQAMMGRMMMMDALCRSLDSIVWDSEDGMDDAAKITASDQTIEQFRAAYAEFLPGMFAAMNGKTAADLEQKVGRTISAATRTKIQEAITALQALLGSETAGTPGAPEPAADPAPELAKQQPPDPAIDHSATQILIDKMRSLIPKA